MGGWVGGWVGEKEAYRGFLEFEGLLVNVHGLVGQNDVVSALAFTGALGEESGWVGGRREDELLGSIGKGGWVGGWDVPVLHPCHRQAPGRLDRRHRTR